MRPSTGVRVLERGDKGPQPHRKQVKGNTEVELKNTLALDQFMKLFDDIIKNVTHLKANPPSKENIEIKGEYVSKTPSSVVIHGRKYPISTTHPIFQEIRMRILNLGDRLETSFGCEIQCDGNHIVIKITW